MKKIVVIGPESTGKSTLCQQLAAHYETAWCPEYARAYLNATGPKYSVDDLNNIARGQLAAEEAFASDAQNNLYFIDTDMYVMKVWFEIAFQQCPTWILKTIAVRSYHLYLLCDTDLPWVADELREYPDLAFRQKLFKIYNDLMVNSGVPFTRISGTDADRLQSAKHFIDSFIK